MEHQATPRLSASEEDLLFLDPHDLLRDPSILLDDAGLDGPLDIDEATIPHAGDKRRTSITLAMDALDAFAPSTPPRLEPNEPPMLDAVEKRHSARSNSNISDYFLHNADFEELIASTPLDVALGSMVAAASAPSGRQWTCVFTSQFFPQYWRNDRKNLQCFPLCREYGEYSVGRRAGLEHVRQGPCSEPVTGTLSAPAGIGEDILDRLRIFGRFVEARSPMGASVLDPISQVPLGDAMEPHMLRDLKRVSCAGQVDRVARDRLDFFVPPSSRGWKFDVPLDRNKKSKGHTARFAFEVVIVGPGGHSAGGGSLQHVYSRARSPEFEITSTRTLTRDIQQQEQQQVASQSIDNLFLADVDFGEDLWDTSGGETSSRKRVRALYAQNKTRAAQADAAREAKAASPSHVPPVPQVDSAPPTPRGSDDIIVYPDQLRGSGKSMEQPLGEGGPRAPTPPHRRESAATAIPHKPFRLSLAFVLWLPPFGFFGAHHVYLDRQRWAAVNCATVGVLLVSWVLDAFRLPMLVSEANLRTDSGRVAHELQLSELALVWAVLGLFGGHHFALHRWGWGVLYACTLGGFVVGWLLDGARLDALLESEAKVNSSMKQRSQKRSHVAIPLALEA